VATSKKRPSLSGRHTTLVRVPASKKVLVKQNTMSGRVAAKKAPARHPAKKVAGDHYCFDGAEELAPRKTKPTKK
jgi:hypothetical protein